MLSNFVKLGVCVMSMCAISAHSLTINGSPRSNTLSICFDESTIGSHIGSGSILALNKSWVRGAIEDESWGYYTNINFIGWNDCASNPSADIRISQDANGGVYSSGDTIYLPFSNPSNPNYQRYHVQSAAVHEMGHQLKFPHEHIRPDSDFYVSGDSTNQKFRFTSAGGNWYTIRPDINTNLCLTVSATNNNVTQESCNSSLAQQFSLKDGPFGSWTRLENRLNQRCLNLSGGNTNWGAELIHWSCNGDDNELFKTKAYAYANLSQTLYGIQVKHSSLWLDIPGGDDAAGVQPIQYPAYFNDFTYLTASYDEVSVMSYENGSLRPSSFILLDDDIDGARSIYGDSGAPKLSEFIVAKISNKCLEFDAANSIATQQTCDGAEEDQKFRITYLDQHYFRILDDETQTCLTESSNQLIMTACAGESPGSVNNNQRFRMLEGESAAWSRIQSKSSGNCLDVAWGDTSDGVEIVLWGCHSDDNQKFTIEKNL